MTQTVHKNYLLTKCSSPRIFLFFRVMELNSAQNSSHRSERSNSTRHYMRSTDPIECHQTFMCEVDRSLAVLQNCNGVVCSRTEIIHYIWSTRQLCRQFVKEFILIFRFSLATVYMIWFFVVALLAYFPSSCYVYLSPCCVHGRVIYKFLALVHVFDKVLSNCLKKVSSS